MKTKKQKKSDKAFIKKISSLTVCGKGVNMHKQGCPICSKTASHAHPVAVGKAIPWTPPRHNDSEEQAISA